MKDKWSSRYDPLFPRLDKERWRKMNDEIARRHHAGLLTDVDRTDAARSLVYDQQWHALNRPQYKLTASAVDALLRTKLPMPLEECPAPFPILAISLPDTRRFQGVDGPIGSFLFAREEKTQHRQAICSFIARQETDGRTVWGYAPLGDLGTDYGKYSTEDWLRSLVGNAGEVTNILRLGLALCVLATGKGREFIGRDCLRVDEPKWNPEREDELGNKADCRTGRHTWVVGRDLPCPYPQKDAIEYIPTGKQLTYSHWREWHYRRQHVGGAANDRIEWRLIPMTKVRPDLPDPPIERSYRVA